MDPSGPLHGPVCRAKFRETRQCSRCGADLSVLMTLAASAHRYRTNARNAIRAGNFKKASAQAKQAQEFHATEEGRRLRLLTRWLDEIRLGTAYLGRLSNPTGLGEKPPKP